MIKMDAVYTGKKTNSVRGFYVERSLNDLSVGGFISKSKLRLIVRERMLEIAKKRGDEKEISFAEKELERMQALED